MDKVSLLAGSTLTTSNYLLTKLWTFVVITVESCVSLEQCRVTYWTKRVHFNLHLGQMLCSPIW